MERLEKRVGNLNKHKLARFDYVDISEGQKQSISEIRLMAKELAVDIITKVPEGRGQSMALTKLEECLYYANKGVCGND